MNQMKIHVEVKINPTESEEKVKRPIRNFFDRIPIKIIDLDKGSLLVSEGQGAEILRNFYELIRKEQIRNATRSILFKGLNNNAIIFNLNKQAAYAGHISFSTEREESPLGPIEVRIEGDNPREIINWLAPKKT